MKRTRWRASLVHNVLGMVALASPLAGQGASRSGGDVDPGSSDARLIASLRSYIPHAMRLTGVPGLNLAIARRGKIVWEGGFGYADVARKIPMTPATVMHGGSTSKLYTVTAVMQLVERGVLGLHQPINRYLERFQVSNPLGERQITVYDLLTHRSGLGSNAASSQFTPPIALGEHLARAFAKHSFPEYDWSRPMWINKVGQRYQYSNLGMATLGYLVEVTNPEGLGFSEYLQKHVIDALGMKSTQYPTLQDRPVARPDIVAKVSTGYARLGPLLIPTPPIHFADYPAGNVLTTPGDHIRLLLAFMNGGEFEGRRILSPETNRLLLTPQAPSSSGANAEDWVSLGVEILNYNTPLQGFGHAGAHMYGWETDARAYPSLDFAIVIGTNNWDVPTRSIRRDLRVQRARELIPDFIITWLENEAVSVKRQPESQSWAWKTSYVAGLIMADRLTGFLGIEAPISPAMVDAMASGALTMGEERDVWDAAGFRAGIADLVRAGRRRDAIRAFLRSEQAKVGPEELKLLWRQLGGVGDALIPAW